MLTSPFKSSEHQKGSVKAMLKKEYKEIICKNCIKYNCKENICEKQIDTCKVYKCTEYVSIFNCNKKKCKNCGKC